MLFACDADGMRIRLRIDRYQSPAKHEYGDWWCDCGYSFQMGKFLCYEAESVEILTPEDVDYLSQKLSDLLSGKITENEEASFPEPDFAFKFYPKTPETDISLEWIVNFWDRGALTANFLTITLDRDKIELLNNFLCDCIRRDGERGA